MNNKELEKIIKKDSEKSTPDIWQGISDDIKNGRGEVVTVTPEKRKSRVLSFVSSIAAALVLVSAAVFGIANYNRADLKPVSTVYLEVNPQIELSLNTYDVVLDAIAKNEDGQKVLGTMELKDSQLEVALNAILGSMVKNGYLTNDANSVLISVENKNKNQIDHLNNEVLKAVKNNEFSFAAIVQTVENTSELKAEAEKLNITSGKAEFIHTIKEKGAKATEEDLSGLSVHELNLIYQSHIKNNDVKEGTGYKGAAASSKYIGIQKAKEIALKDAKVDEKGIKDFEVDFDFEYGKMVYEVEFEVGGKEYDYALDATSGEILASHNGESKPKAEASSSPSVSSKPDNIVIVSSDKMDAIMAPEAALKIALSHAGLESSNVTDVDVEFDDDRAYYHYDVDFNYGGYDYEYEIDAISGKVLKNHKEFDD